MSEVHDTPVEATMAAVSTATVTTDVEAGVDGLDNDPAAALVDDLDNDTADVDPHSHTNAASSLHYSLLGPSLLKAGQGGVDQSKVSEIIYNASKGSKFFEHESRRDEQLTERIAAILKRKEELEKTDLRPELRRADEQVGCLAVHREKRLTRSDCPARKGARSVPNYWYLISNKRRH